MTSNKRSFNFHSSCFSIDKFLEKILYEPKKGYYAKKNPFGNHGDFITSPTISNLFSEIIAIWVVSSWQKLGEPKKFNFVELGPGDGSLTKILVETFKKFPKLNNSVKIFLYEKSDFLKKEQKKKLKGFNINWIKNFDKIKNGPVIFFGNEFFDAIPIKQFFKKNNSLYEKYYLINSVTGISETYKKAKVDDYKVIKSFKVLRKLKFIEYPKLGFLELDKIISKIKILSGGILLIDYGYSGFLNKSTLQAVKKNKKINMKELYSNLGNVDVTSLVNFKLLEEYFFKKKLKVKKIVSQKFFLERMGIVQRAKILERKMTDKQKDYMSVTLKRLLHKELMGELFKVIFAFKSKNSNFLGFN